MIKRLIRLISMSKNLFRIDSVDGIKISSIKLLISKNEPYGIKSSFK